MMKTKARFKGRTRHFICVNVIILYNVTSTNENTITQRRT